MTSKYSTAGIGMVYTQVKATPEELALRKKKSARVKAAKAKPEREVTLPWPPGFVSAIKVNKHGQML